MHLTPIVLFPFSLVIEIIFAISIYVYIMFISMQVKAIE